VQRALVISVAVLLASCTEEEAQVCPGEVVARFDFSGDGRTAGELEAGLDPDPALTDCSAAVGFPTPRPPLRPFGGALAAEPGSAAGAMCRADGLVLFGTRDGTRWVVETSTDGAVLPDCGVVCAARSRVVISGDVAGTRFEGALVEQLSATAGDCSACALPCAARYSVVGTP
jgi:hypothetical protein